MNNILLSHPRIIFWQNTSFTRILKMVQYCGLGPILRIGRRMLFAKKIRNIFEYCAFFFSLDPPLTILRIFLGEQYLNDPKAQGEICNALFGVKIPHRKNTCQRLVYKSLFIYSQFLRKFTARTKSQQIQNRPCLLMPFFCALFISFHIELDAIIA